MSCPRCRSAFDHGSESCPSCQFSLALARQAFPFAAPPLEFLVDPTRVLPEGAEPELCELYEALRTTFPQIRISLSLLNLAPGTSLREFAFWWFNEAPGGDEGRQWHILLLADAQSRALSLTPGYALEPHLQAANWEAVLGKVAATANSDGWTNALKIFLKAVPLLLEADWNSAQPGPSEES